MPNPSIQIPSWLTGAGPGQAQSQMQTLSGQAPDAFSSAGLTKAVNSASALNLSEGIQAANNAGTEYANRAIQSGASTLGAGAVKAQALLGAYGENANMKLGLAQTQSTNSQAAAKYQAALSGQMGELSSQYAQTLSDYTNRQGQLGIEQQNTDLGRQQLKSNNLQFYLSHVPLPSVSWTSDLNGSPIGGGQSVNNYNRYQAALGSQNSAKSQLLRM